MKRSCLIIFSFLMILSSYAQKQEILLTIDNEKVTKEEFQRIYNKNKTNLSTGEITSVDEYLDLFINFKLKVLEAKKMGLDTVKNFASEFEGYKKQLVAPYLIDEETNKRVIDEAYERMQYEVRASHILVKLTPDAIPSDTIEAYEKAMDIRRRILQGEPFEKVAKGSSEDPSVKNNGGDLGYFTVFQMIYPFESAVYNAKAGEITKPIKTRFGYHIVKVTDKRKARGEVKVAHIMLTVPRGTPPEVEKEKKKLINELYHKAKQGEDFAKLAREYSDDKGSARNGGELPWFGSGRMVEEFEKAAFDLKTNGEISQPVRTGFGWHILKRIDRREIPEYNEAIEDIKRKVAKDKRYEVAQKALIDKLKTDYNFIEEKDNSPAKFDTIEHRYIVNQKYLQNNSKLDQTLFSFLNKKYTEKDFYDFVKSRKGENELRPYDYKLMYDKFVENKILEIEESRLQSKYPEYKYLLKEYFEGMLLFEVTDQKVWSKAVQDSTGLKEFYEKNKQDYMWDERWQGSVYYCSNEDVCKKVSKIISKGSFGKKITNDNLLEQFNSDQEVLKIESRIFEQGDSEVIDHLVWNKGTNTNKLILIKGKIIKPAVKEFSSCKGLVISDYQDFLDKEWTKSLRAKYNINIDQSVLSSVK